MKKYLLLYRCRRCKTESYRSTVTEENFSQLCDRYPESRIECLCKSFDHGNNHIGIADLIGYDIIDHLVEMKGPS